MPENCVSLFLSSGFTYFTYFWFNAVGSARFPSTSKASGSSRGAAASFWRGHFRERADLRCWRVRQASR